MFVNRYSIYIINIGGDAMIDGHVTIADVMDIVERYASQSFEDCDDMNCEGCEYEMHKQAFENGRIRTLAEPCNHCRRSSLDRYKKRATQ